jgi:3-oxoacyl-[acyl-carrier-protein] synthase-1
MASPSVQIIRLGARTPLGLGALQTTMCARAGKLEPRRTSFRDSTEASIGAVRAPCLPDDLHGYERLLALGAPALREAAGDLEGPIPLLLALPEAGRPDDDPRFEAELLAALGEKSGVSLDLARSEIFRAGQAGVGLAVERALARLREAPDRKRAPMVIVGGLDSYYHPELLAWLDRTHRLHSLTTVNGFVPGEAAAFVVLSTPVPGAAARENKATAPIAFLPAVVTGREETVLGDEPNVALAMTRTVRAALAGVAEPVRWLLSDLNGERHRVTEYSRVTIRMSDLIPTDVDHTPIPERFGDVGAASGALMLVLACTLFQTRAAPAERALLLLHAEGPERAALLLEAAPWSDPPQGTPRKETPARREAPVQQEAIDRVIASLRKLPEVDRRAPLKAVLDDALMELSRWAAADLHGDDHLARLDAALAQIEAACALLEGTGDEGAQAKKNLRGVERGLRAAREATLDRIVSEQDGLLRGERPADEPARPFLTSSGVPVIHATSDAPLVPLVTVGPSGDRELSALRARLSRSAASGEEAQIRALARDCMEDLAILGTLRRNRGDEPWAASHPFEQRLLANIDALSSLNVAPAGARPEVDVRAILLEYALETAFADKGRAFARAFALGCADGEDAIRVAVAGIRQSSPLTHPAQQEALCIASSPRIEAAMERLLWDDDPAMIRLGLDVLSFRRKARIPALIPLLSHADPRVLSGVLRCLGTAEPREAAVAALSDAVDERADDRSLAVAAESLVRRGAPTGLGLAVRRLRHEDEHPGSLHADARCAYVRLLSLAGGPEHARAIAAHAIGLVEGASAIGWFGQVDLIEPLLVQLAAANELRRSMVGYVLPYELAAARALVRITGVYLESPEPLLNLDLSIEEAHWRAWWDEHRGDFRSDQRYRFGKPYHPLESLAELADDDTPAYVRSELALELAQLSTRPWAFEPSDWVSRQRGEIDAIRLELEAAMPYEPGEWPTQYLTRRPKIQA